MPLPLRALVVAAGALTLMAPATSVASTPSEFVARADQICHQYFAAVDTLDRQVKRHLGPPATAQAQIVLTADLLGFNGRLSLNAETRLSRLRAPDGGERLWKSALSSDRTGGALTLHLAEQLTQLSSPQAADRAVNAYDATYERTEVMFTRDVRRLHITGCI